MGEDLTEQKDQPLSICFKIERAASVQSVEFWGQSVETARQSEIRLIGPAASHVRKPASNRRINQRSTTSSSLYKGPARKIEEASRKQKMYTSGNR